MVVPAGVPVITGDTGTCSGCGVATLGIDYYELGQITGEMAYEILVNGADPAEMAIQYAPQFTPKYNPTMCEALGQSPWQGIEQVREKVHVTSSVSDEIPRDDPYGGKGGKGVSLFRPAG